MTSLLGVMGQSKIASCVGFTLDNMHLIPYSSGSNGKSSDDKKEYIFVHYAGTGDYVEANTPKGIKAILDAQFVSFPDKEIINLRQKLPEEFEMIKKKYPATFAQFTDLDDFLKKGGNIVASVPLPREVGKIAQQKLADGKITIWKEGIKPLEN